MKFMKDKGVKFDSSKGDKARFKRLQKKYGTETAQTQFNKLKFEYQLYNVWNFNGCDPRFGSSDFEGRIPGQIILNLVYYYTEEGDLVVDPMAGSGTTYDVCQLMKRKVLCYDIEPVREFIEKHNIREGFPFECKNAKLIVLDPPYYNMVFLNLFENVDAFYSFIEGLAKSCFEIVAPHGFVALLMQDMTEKGRYCLSGESYNRFRKVGFESYEHISCPLSSQQFLPQQVQRAKQEKRLLGRNRDLYVFRKK